MSAVATLDAVTMRFRGHTALTDLSTAIEADTITGLLGRNGAGKTTLMQLLTGHRVPTAGRVEVFGRSPYEDDDVLRQTCTIKESQRYPDLFRVCHALAAASWVYPQWDADLAGQLMDDFELPAKSCSTTGCSPTTPSTRARSSSRRT